MSLLHRPRRLRRTEAIRRLVRETRLSADDLVYPFFVTHEKGAKEDIPSMPGCFRWGVDRAVEPARAAAEAGLPAVLLFGIPAAKDPDGSGAWDPDGVVQQAVRAIKSACPDLLVITDVCLCEYTSHGHCGLIQKGEVLNDATLEILARTAVSHARAGADIVAPSDMMDGRVAAIRSALDAADFSHIPILSYAAKYASAYYGPFRDAAASAPAFGDRRAYQMDPPNRCEALREIRLDLEEGADMVMVKPGLAYLDIVRDVRETFPDVPLAVYNVSGEYAMLKAAAQRGWLDEQRTVIETLTAFKRAGADFILTYHALDAAEWLGRQP
ncbi:MAG: porphobilinogen synthase [Candidatus Sumerlaeia bacterium]